MEPDTLAPDGEDVFPFPSPEDAGLGLQFFVNMTLFADGADLLEKYGLSQTQFRVLAFANRYSGVTVGVLVDVMRVTHQNLHAPMRKLVDRGLLVMQIGAKDRRQRFLFPSDEGRHMCEEILKRQLRRIKAAYAAAGEDAVRGYLKVMRLLIDERSQRTIAMHRRPPDGAEA